MSDPSEQAHYIEHLTNMHGVSFQHYEGRRLPPRSFLRQIHDMEHNPANPHAVQRMNPLHEHLEYPEPSTVHTNWRADVHGGTAFIGTSPDAMRWTPAEGDEEMQRWESLFHDRRRDR